MRVNRSLYAILALIATVSLVAGVEADTMDDFDDNTLDTSQWGVSLGYSGTVVEANQRLEIYGGSNSFGAASAWFKDGIDLAAADSAQFSVDIVGHTIHVDTVNIVTNSLISVLGDVSSDYKQSNYAGILVKVLHKTDAQDTNTIEVYKKDAGNAGQDGVKLWAGSVNKSDNPVNVSIMLDQAHFAVSFDRPVSPFEGWSNTALAGEHGWDLATDLPVGHLHLKNQQEYAGRGTVYFDNASQSSVIPEPSSLGLLLGGGLCLLGRWGGNSHV